MNQKEKLIELLSGINVLDYPTANFIECLADYLLANGIVVLPCKVGDMVYCVFSPPYPADPADKGKWFLGAFEVGRFHYGVKGLSMGLYRYGSVNINQIGKTVFLTRKEAEKALREREDNA